MSPTSPSAVVLEQPAVWPAPSVTVDTPEAAAEEFVAAVLGVDPNLGELGWYVLAALSDTNTIDTPEPGSAAPAGPLQVTGSGRGFEALLVVEAFMAGSGEFTAIPVLIE